jgi:hypothetical protein
MEIQALLPLRVLVVLVVLVLVVTQEELVLFLEYPFQGELEVLEGLEIMVLQELMVVPVPAALVVLVVEEAELEVLMREHLLRLGEILVSVVLVDWERETYFL